MYLRHGFGQVFATKRRTLYVNSRHPQLIRSTANFFPSYFSQRSMRQACFSLVNEPRARVIVRAHVGGSCIEVRDLANSFLPFSRSFFSSGRLPFGAAKRDQSSPRVRLLRSSHGPAGPAVVSPLVLTRILRVCLVPPVLSLLLACCPWVACGVCCSFRNRRGMRNMRGRRRLPVVWCFFGAAAAFCLAPRMLFSFFLPCFLLFPTLGKYHVVRQPLGRPRNAPKQPYTRQMYRRKEVNIVFCVLIFIAACSTGSLDYGKVL